MCLNRVVNTLTESTRCAIWPLCIVVRHNVISLLSLMKIGPRHVWAGKPWFGSKQEEAQFKGPAGEAVGAGVQRVREIGVRTSE